MTYLIQGFCHILRGRMFTLLHVVGLSLLLASCAMPPLSRDVSLSEERLFQAERFMDSTRTRSQEDARRGPAALRTADAELRKRNRRHIVTERVEAADNIAALSQLYDVFPIDLHVENMDMPTFIQLLSEITQVNFVVSPEVSGLVTVKLENVPWTAALETVLEMKQLASDVDSKTGIVRIHDYNTIMAIEDFQRKRHENIQKSMQLKAASQPVHTEVFKLFYTKPDEVKRILDDALKNSRVTNDSKLRNTDPEITIDPRKNQIIVRARAEELDVAAKLISEIDSRTEQVFIEAFIVEVTDGFEKAFGSRIGLVGQEGDVSFAGLAGESAGGLTLGGTASTAAGLALGTATSGIGFLTSLGSAADLKLELTALEAKGLTKVISNPKIFTLDNKEAVIFQGNEVPYETTSDEGTNVEFKEAGLRLAVTPSVVGDGNLMLTIQVNKDTVDTSQPNPPIRKSEINTSLVSRDGAIVVIGGIYDENSSQATDQVPGLGDLPGIGRLFKRDARENTRRELMVFIAPKVI